MRCFATQRSQIYVYNPSWGGMLLPEKLTPREREIVPFLTVGATRAEIVKALGIADETVKIHNKNILRKFGPTNLRDGFEDIAAYQRYYGLDGVGLMRFTKSICVTTRFFPSKSCSQITRNETIVAMNGTLDVFYRQFHVENLVVCNQYRPDRIQATESFPKKGVKRVALRIVPPLADGDELTYTEEVLAAKRKFKQIDNEGVTWSIPFAKRVMRYVFPEDEVPKKIWYETLTNITPIKLSGTKEVWGPNFLELDISDFQQSTTLRVHWDY